MPKEIEDYVHQIGRTGRSGKTGIATTFVNMNTSEQTLLDLKYLLKEAKQRCVAPAAPFAAFSLLGADALLPLCGTPGSRPSWLASRTPTQASQAPADAPSAVDSATAPTTARSSRTPSGGRRPKASATAGAVSEGGGVVLLLYMDHCCRPRCRCMLARSDARCRTRSCRGLGPRRSW
jgi:superfamily II DNA/RNA helicase